MSDFPTHRELGWAIRDLTDSSLCSTKRLLLLVCLQCVNVQLQFKWSYESLAHCAGLQRRCTTTHMSQLIKYGYIIIIKRGGRGKNDPHLMQLNHKKIFANSNLKRAPDARLRSNNSHKRAPNDTQSVHLTTLKRAPDAHEASVEASVLREHAPSDEGRDSPKQSLEDFEREFKRKLGVD
jgi:hypothetical protein